MTSRLVKSFLSQRKEGCREGNGQDEGKMMCGEYFRLQAQNRKRQPFRNLRTSVVNECLEKEKCEERRGWRLQLKDDGS